MKKNLFDSIINLILKESLLGGNISSTSFDQSNVKKNIANDKNSQNSLSSSIEELIKQIEGGSEEHKELVKKLIELSMSDSNKKT
jgi:hypothetical protein